MEKILKLSWEIHEYQNHSEERYCHNCGKKVVFTDSLKRRQNANGKNIFYYAIYKCPKEHSWNKVINTFKATSGLENMDETLQIQESKMDTLMVEDLIQQGYQSIEIDIQSIGAKMRIDKLLASQIKDWSRSRIEDCIKKGNILVNGEMIQPKHVLRENHRVTLNLQNIK